MNKRDEFRVQEIDEQKLIAQNVKKEIDMAQVALKKEQMRHMCSICLGPAAKEPQTCIQCDELFCLLCIADCQRCPVC